MHEHADFIGLMAGTVRVAIFDARNGNRTAARWLVTAGLAERAGIGLPPAVLAANIAEHGLQQVPCVRPRHGRYQLVYGERRYRAILLLGWPLLPVVIRDLDDSAAFRAMLVENNQRKDPDPIDQAQGFQRAI